MRGAEDVHGSIHDPVGGEPPAADTSATRRPRSASVAAMVSPDGFAATTPQCAERCPKTVLQPPVFRS